MIEILLRLAAAGYNISEYKYLGFGSPYYVDFIMFHKYLFIGDMVCVEWAEVGRRMRFNKPYKFITLRLGPLSEYIPNIRATKEYLVWLDYDRALDPEVLQDIDGCLTRLGKRSILIVTVDARPKLPIDLFDVDQINTEQRENLTVATYQEWFGQYLGAPVTNDAISGQHAATLFHAVLAERMRMTLATRGDGLRFLQLFNYVYKDGAPMLTVGGIIGTDGEGQVLRESGVLNHSFACTTPDSVEISVPPLTIREKQWLDSRLDKKLTADKLRFELDQELLDNYRKFYKEYPTYLESLL